MSFQYFDAHCHVQFDQYDTDRDALIERMREEKVGGIVVGCDRESSKNAVDLVKQHEHLYASVGLHPNNTGETLDKSSFVELLKNPNVVAIGECGLDYFRPEDANEEVKKKQKELFKTHLALAEEFDKPLIIHSRPSKGTMDSYWDLIEILTEKKKAYPNLRGDIHFFVGGVDEAKALIDLGFTVSFTAVITFARDYDVVIRSVPLASVLSETDAPYVAPASRRGQRNDPLAVVEVAQKIAEIRDESVETVRESLVENAQRLFALPEGPW